MLFFFQKFFLERVYLWGLFIIQFNIKLTFRGFIVADKAVCQCLNVLQLIWVFMAQWLMLALADFADTYELNIHVYLHKIKISGATTKNNDKKDIV